MRTLVLFAVSLALPAAARAEPPTSTLTYGAEATFVGEGAALGDADLLYGGSVMASRLGGHFAVGFDLRLARGDDGGMFYDTNITGGVGAWLGARVAVTLTAGFGTSGMTDRVPFAIQVPVELALQAHPSGRAHVVLFVRGSRLYANARQRDTSLPGADSTQAGLRWLFASPAQGPIIGAPQRAWLGVTLHELMGGGAVTLGIGLGAYHAPARSP